MSLVAGNEGGHDHPARPAPHSDSAIVIVRAGFQSLPQANNAVEALLNDFEPLGEGTAGSAIRVPTARLAELLRGLATVLDDEHLHQGSGEHIRGSRGIDNWSIAIQAEKPRP